ncbi:MAG: sigma-70 family RNA polymerase sigma factor [Clostridia bacterium]
MTKHETSVLRMCCAYLQDMHLAQDAAQETFLKAYAKWDAFRGDCEEKTWLMRIAINTCKDIRRGAWFRCVERRVTPQDLPEPAVPLCAAQDELSEDILRLPRKYLEVVLLYYYQNMTTREVALALELPQSTVISRLKRARDKLRIMLTGGGTDA